MFFEWWKQRRALKAWNALRVQLAGKGPMNFTVEGRLGSKEADALWQEACRLTDAALEKPASKRPDLPGLCGSRIRH